MVQFLHSMLRRYSFGTSSATFEKPPSPARTKKLLIAAAALFVIVLGIIIGSFLLYKDDSEPTGLQTEDITLTPQKNTIFSSLKNFFFGERLPLVGEENDRINILLLGIGGPGHEGSNLSDTNIIASIRPTTKDVALISIPRDLMVKMPVYNYQKINAVHAYNELRNPGLGPELSRQFFAEQFETPIPYYIRVDFKAFEDIIDAVGGITVNVGKSFVDYRYPNPGKAEGADCVGETEASPCRYLKVSFTTGEEKMNGRRALMFARSRHGSNGEGSDFARSRRQQQVLLALKEKVLSLGTLGNPVALKNIMDSVANHVSTNLTFNDLLAMAGFARTIESEKVKTVVLDDNGRDLLTGVRNQLGDVLVPRSGSFKAINELIANVFSPSTTLTRITVKDVSTPAATSTKSAPITVKPTSLAERLVALEIQNGTWEVGLAAKLKKDLEGQGIPVRSIGNTTERPIGASGLYVINESATPTARALAQKLQLDLITKLPNWILEPYTNPSSSGSWSAASSTQPLTPPDLIIVLGTDFATTTR